MDKPLIEQIWGPEALIELRNTPDPELDAIDDLVWEVYASHALSRSTATYDYLNPLKDRGAR